MAKFTKKWQKEFEKRYSNAILELKNLEAEYKEMKDSNPDEFYLEYIMPKEDTIALGEMDTYSLYELSDDPNRNEVYADFTFNFKIAKVNFKITDLKNLIAFRNELMNLIDEYKRPLVEAKKTIDDDCEDEEGWEDNEEQEYTIQASRSCVQTWTHTVMARTVCEAYRKAQEGEGHDENDDYDSYGDIDYESI